MKTLKYLFILFVAAALLSSCEDTTTEPLVCANPVINPASGTYNTAQTVTIATVTADASIYYTLDGSFPDSTSILYAGPFVVYETATIRALAMKAGWEDSAVVSETITIDYDQCETPVITPAGGTYTAAQQITITCATAGATIKYTTNGTDPDTTSTTYTAPFMVDTNTTIKAYAFKEQMDDSPIATQTYIVYAGMVSVPAGTFNMGRTVGAGDADELPVHNVTLDAFYIGKYEVTQAEWMNMMGANPSAFPGDDRPVEMVNFYSVLVYCNKKSMAEGLQPVYSINGSTNPDGWGAIPNTNNVTWNNATQNLNANGYRLPTEAEWEYAARGAANTPDYLYAGSDTIGDVAWYEDNSSAATHVAGGKAANGLGIFDLTGNVQEWVWDWFSLTYYAESPANNPTGPATGTGRTIRGGSWFHNAASCRIHFRNFGTPEKGEPKVSNDRLGFRVVRKAI